MYLFNDKWEVYISGVNYNPDSVDNTVRADTYVGICDDYSKAILLKISDISHAIEKNIVLKVSFFTPQTDFAFMEGDSLFLFLNDTVCELDIPTGKVINEKRLNLMGTLFSVYRYHQDFIMYCEMDIIRITRSLEVVWDFSARDIFVRYHGEEPAFEMLPDRIRLYDFSDNYYEIDYDGKVIRD